MSKKIQLRIFPDGRVQAEVQVLKAKLVPTILKF